MQRDSLCPEKNLRTTQKTSEINYSTAEIERLDGSVAFFIGSFFSTPWVKETNIRALTVASKTMHTLFTPVLQEKIKECIFDIIATDITTEDSRPVGDETLREHKKYLALAHSRCKIDRDFAFQLFMHYIACNKLDEAQVHFNSYLSNQPLDKQSIIKIFFQYVVCGHQHKAAEYLMQHPGLLFEHLTFTDCSSRTFKSITAFQYVLWAGDSYMAAMMLHFFSKLHSGLKEAKQQAEQLEKYGISYHYNDREKSTLVTGERHFDWNRIITVLESSEILGALDDDDEAYNRLWYDQICKEQKNLPIHIIQEYCQNYTHNISDPSLDDNSTSFKRLDFERRIKLTYYNANLYCHCAHSSPPSMVNGGGIVGFRKPGSGEVSIQWMPPSKDALKNDMLALRTLHKVRDEDRKSIYAYLENSKDNALPEHLNHQNELAETLISSSNSLSNNV